jgi:hypothetical protein
MYLSFLETYILVRSTSVCLLNAHMLKSNHQCHDVKRWGHWEMIIGHEDKIYRNRISDLKAPERCLAPFACEDTAKRHCL